MGNDGHMPRFTSPTWQGPTPPRWEWPRQYDALDRLEREIVEDVAATILSAKLARQRASLDDRALREPEGAVLERTKAPSPAR